MYLSLCSDLIRNEKYSRWREIVVAQLGHNAKKFLLQLTAKNCSISKPQQKKNDLQIKLKSRITAAPKPLQKSHIETRKRLTMTPNITIRILDCSGGIRV